MTIGMRIAVGAVAILAAAGPVAAIAPASVAVYSDKATFLAERPGIQSGGFAFTTQSSGTQLTSPYSVDGVTFTSTLQRGFNDAVFGVGAPVLSAFAPLTITFNGPVLGLTLSSLNTPRAFLYSVNGQAGSVQLGTSPTFIGFDTGIAGSITVIFAQPNARMELDVLSFNTAVPEPGTWGMLLLGVGMIGGTMRYRRRVGTTKIAYA